MILRSSSAKNCNREWILPLNDNSKLPGKFYRGKIPLASIIVSRTWKLRFTSKRISRYGYGLVTQQLMQNLIVLVKKKNTFLSPSFGNQIFAFIFCVSFKGLKLKIRNFIFLQKIVSSLANISTMEKAHSRLILGVNFCELIFKFCGNF